MDSLNVTTGQICSLYTPS